MNDDIQIGGGADSDLELIEDAEASLPDIKKKLVDLRERLASCEKEKKEYLDGWQRAKADHINYKKEEAKRLEDIARFANGSLIEDLLPVLDSFELALQSDKRQVTSDKEDVIRGILLIRSQLIDVLKRRGLEEISVKAGDEFFPEKHESIGEVESDAPAGAIAEKMQKGYTLADRVIRPARVRLSKSRTI